MHPNFWHTRWERGEIGFHSSEVNPYLQQFWGRLGVPSGACVFVPLCGKSCDMLWLHSQGYVVVGVELSPLAVKAFFDEAGPPPVQSSHGKLQCHEAEGVAILCGDFFDLVAADLEQITAVYDRASLIALPPEMRARYARHLRQLLPAGAQMLLVTLDYPQRQMQGPPFAVSEQEVHLLYDDLAEVERLASRDVLGENEKFAQRGVTRLQKNIYRVTFR